MVRRLALLALILALPGMEPGLAAAQPVLADGTAIRPEDRERLAGLDESIGAALRQALAAGTGSDIDQIVRAFLGVPIEAGTARQAIAGEWSCRMIKMGGLLPVTVYPPYRCLTDGTEFEKLTGSQRTKGVLHLDGDRLVYLGTGFIAGDTPTPYAELPSITDPQAVPQRIPEIGVVELTGSDSGRILFPDPYLEARANILVLSRGATPHE